MPFFRRSKKGPIEGSVKEINSVTCYNCSLLLETVYYGSLHEHTENEVGYYYNVSEERSVEKGGGFGIGASLQGPNIEANYSRNVVTSNGVPQILMFHIIQQEGKNYDEEDSNDEEGSYYCSSYCCECFKDMYQSTYRGVLLSLDHTANIRCASEYIDEEDEGESKEDEEEREEDEEENEENEECSEKDTDLDDEEEDEEESEEDEEESEEVEEENEEDEECSEKDADEDDEEEDDEESEEDEEECEEDEEESEEDEEENAEDD